MFSTNLNDVNPKVGMVITLTSEFNSANRALVKHNPLLNTSNEFEIVETIEKMAMDDQTELLDKTVGATILKHIKTGTLLNIEDPEVDEKDANWAFVTTFTPDMFIIVKTNDAS